MKIKFLGAAKVVTGSCYLIESNNTKFLVECGMFQGKKEITKLNYLPFNFDPKEISFVLLTHAHIDHSGLIPKLVKHGFKGKVYATSSTIDLCRILFEDSAHIQEESVLRENNRREKEGLEPRITLYNHKDAIEAMMHFQAIKKDEEFNIGPIKICYRKAGHILGSAIIEIFIEGKKLVFSGDLGQDSELIVGSPTKIKETDYLFMESTYGDRLHSHTDIRLKKLAEVINETYEKGGKLLIPIFAIERTQELLFSIEELYKKRLIPKQNVYLDTPLGIKATQIFRNHPESMEDSFDFKFPNLIFTPDVKSSMRINQDHNPAIIMAGNGMCTAGRIRHHIKHQITDKRNTILFVGYQAEGTTGQIILSGEKEIKMMGYTYNVNAEVKEIDSFSGHADQAMLLRWLKGFETKPKKVFLIHGEGNASLVFEKKVNELDIKTYIPNINEEIEL
jgi:metallo-beta-lactamase family protein